MIATLTVAVALAGVPMDVEIRSPDGFAMRGSYYSPGKSGPAIVLFHQCDSDRHVWDRLAGDLLARGFHVLTFDSRGYGQSPGGGRLTPEKIDSDVDAAYNWLAAQRDVQRGNIAVGGGSCGVAQASTVASMHHEVHTIVLLSGALATRPLKYLSSTADVAFFAASADRDPFAGNAVEVAQASKNPHSVAKQYPDAAHGVRLFTAHHELEPELVEWLSNVMK